MDKKQYNLSKLSTREKIGYFWDYYKWVLILLLFFIFLFTIVLGSIFKEKKEPLLSIASAVSLTNEDEVALATVFKEYTGNSDTNESLSFIPILFSEQKGDNINYEVNIQLASMIAAKEMDILIGTGSMYENLQTNNAFYPLHALLEEDDFNANENYVTTQKDAILISALPWGKKWLHVDDQDYYLMILNNTTKLDNAQSFVRYILTYK